MICNFNFSSSFPFTFHFHSFSYIRLFDLLIQNLFNFIVLVHFKFRSYLFLLFDVSQINCVKLLFNFFLFLSLINYLFRLIFKYLFQDRFLFCFFRFLSNHFFCALSHSKILNLRIFLIVVFFFFWIIEV